MAKPLSKLTVVVYTWIAASLPSVLLVHAAVSENTPPSASAQASEPSKASQPLKSPPPARIAVADSVARAVADLRANLDSLGERIDEINAGLRIASATAKREAKQDLNRLQRTRKAIAARLDTLGQTTNAAWKKLKIRAGTEIDSLKADVDRVRHKGK